MPLVPAVVDACRLLRSSPPEQLPTAEGLLQPWRLAQRVRGSALVLASAEAAIVLAIGSF
jgi:hypothetical protein